MEEVYHIFILRDFAYRTTRHDKDSAQSMVTLCQYPACGVGTYSTNGSYPYIYGSTVTMQIIFFYIKRYDEQKNKL